MSAKGYHKFFRTDTENRIFYPNRYLSQQILKCSKLFDACVGVPLSQTAILEMVPILLVSTLDSISKHYFKRFLDEDEASLQRTLRDKKNKLRIGAIADEEILLGLMGKKFSYGSYFVRLFNINSLEQLNRFASVISGADFLKEIQGVSLTDSSLKRIDYLLDDELIVDKTATQYLKTIVNSGEYSFEVVKDLFRLRHQLVHEPNQIQLDRSALVQISIGFWKLILQTDQYFKSSLPPIQFTLDPCLEEDYRMSGQESPGIEYVKSLLSDIDNQVHKLLQLANQLQKHNVERVEGELNDLILGSQNHWNEYRWMTGTLSDYQNDIDCHGLIGRIEKAIVVCQNRQAELNELCNKWENYLKSYCTR